MNPEKSHFPRIVRSAVTDSVPAAFIALKWEVRPRVNAPTQSRSGSKPSSPSRPQAFAAGHGWSSSAPSTRWRRLDPCAASHPKALERLLSAEQLDALEEAW
jgi:hypothetical protein